MDLHELEYRIITSPHKTVSKDAVLELIKGYRSRLSGEGVSIQQENSISPICASDDVSGTMKLLNKIFM